MNLLDNYIRGSVLNPENRKALEFARVRLALVKEEKLQARHKKNDAVGHHGTAYATNVFNHIIEETKELQDALANNDFDNAIEEISDVINCAEILAAILYISNQELKPVSS